MNDKRDLKSCEISSVIQHFGKGYGFKISFGNEVIARHQKDIIMSYLESIGFVCSMRGDYNAE